MIEADEYAALELEHFGDPDRQTGIYAPHERCGWCGHVFHMFEYRPDHKLWCANRPRDI